MSGKSFARRWVVALTALSSLLVIAAVACGGEAAAPAPEPQVAKAPQAPAPAATARAAAPAAPAAAAAATATAAPTAAVVAKAPDAAVATGPQGKVTWAVNLVEGIYGLPFLGPYRGSAGAPLGIHELLFWHDKGDPMAGWTAESWSVDPAGTKTTIKLKKGIPWNSPADAPGLTIGDFDSEDVVWWLNTANATTNPESTHPDAGDFASVLLAAKALDQYTFEINLVAPLYFGLPLSQFGLLGAASGPRSKKAFDKMGLKWLNDHEVGTGAFRQGTCIPNERCTGLAVPKHWRQTAKIAELETIQVPEPTTRVAMLKSGAADLAVLDFKQVPALIKDPNSAVRFIATMPGGFVGLSVIYSGNLWEEFHARTGKELNPWAAPSMAQDYPWIGNPWGDASTGKCTVSATCKPAPYTDTNNPAGMDDMEQARLVRLAFGTAIDRNGVNDIILGGLGTPLYSEYFGPEYPGWDPKRWSGEWSFNDRNPKKAGAVGVGTPWELKFDTAAAEKLLDQAGFPKKADGIRFGLTLQPQIPAEVGEVSGTIADALTSQWTKIGIKVDQVVENYGGVISPRMRQRIQVNPVMKNGDVNSNVWPTDLPYPPVDSSISRPGWGVGFESVPTAQWHFAVNAEKDKSKREKMHYDAADWMFYWQLYNGIVQVPKGVAAGKRIKAWLGHQEHYGVVSANPELMELN